jgi:hypothetical protein
VTRSRLVLACGALAALSAAAAASAFAQEPADATVFEYRVKAAFLLNFAKLTEWPASSFDTPDSPVGICVLGDNPFDGALDDAFENETAQGRPLEARTIRTAADLTGCHILFVPRARTAAAAARLRSRLGVVTVGETERFLERGGCINFIVESGRVRFEVSQEAADRQGVRFSSHLLRLAREADRPPGGGS